MKIINPHIEQYPSVEKISESYDNLKEGVTELAGQVKADASDAASRVGARTYDFVKDKLEAARAEASSDLRKIKTYIREEPAKGVAIAFIAGAVLSLLVRRR